MLNVIVRIMWDQKQGEIFVVRLRSEYAGDAWPDHLFFQKYFQHSVYGSSSIPPLDMFLCFWQRLYPKAHSFKSYQYRGSGLPADVSLLNSMQGFPRQACGLPGLVPMGQWSFPIGGTHLFRRRSCASSWMLVQKLISNISRSWMLCIYLRTQSTIPILQGV